MTPHSTAKGQQTDEWAEGRRYLGLEVLARCRVTTVPATDPEIGAEHLPALTAYPLKESAALHHCWGLDPR